MKPRSTSITLKNAETQKFFSWISITIATIGIPTILTLVPAEHKTTASLILTAVVTFDSVYGASKTQPKIISERLQKGDLYKDPDKESEAERQERLSVPTQELLGPLEGYIPSADALVPRAVKQAQMLQERHNKVGV